MKRSTLVIILILVWAFVCVMDSTAYAPSTTEIAFVVPAEAAEQTLPQTSTPSASTESSLTLQQLIMNTSETTQPTEQQEIIHPPVEELAPPIEHECMPASHIVMATCTTDGYYEAVCDCGYYYREEYPATGHNWSDWGICKVENWTGPAAMVRECQNEFCNEKQSKMVMENLNTIIIPDLRIHASFLNTTECSFGSADLVYYEPLDENHPVITGNFDLTGLNRGTRIYVNTADGLAIYQVDFSEPADMIDGVPVGQNTHRGIFQHDYDASLHLYSETDGQYWLVVARFLGYAKK